MADGTNDKLDTAFELAQFAASAAAVVVAALHRGQPIGDVEVRHLLKNLATRAASAPESAREVFDGLAAVLAGKHYEGG